jgi:hypothetical protein
MFVCRLVRSAFLAGGLARKRFTALVLTSLCFKSLKKLAASLSTFFNTSDVGPPVCL